MPQERTRVMIGQKAVIDRRSPCGMGDMRNLRAHFNKSCPQGPKFFKDV